MKPSTISACLVVHDEERVIGRCLDSLAGVVDDVVLVHDGPCSDRTLEIARAAGARVFERPFAGHSEAHGPFAYEQATGEWLLGIDADEFLSPEMARVLPELARRQDVNAFEFIWPTWDGTRYTTTDGPHKMVMFRRSATHMLGMIHERERVDGPIERTDYVLEHRPAYNNWGLRTMTTKWRRWARIQAREMTGSYAALPKFNWQGPWDWPPRRRLLNALSPVLLPAYAVGTFAFAFKSGLESLNARESLRFALYQAVYATMVQVYVARLTLRRLAGRPEA